MRVSHTHKLFMVLRLMDYNKKKFISLKILEDKFMDNTESKKSCFIVCPIGKEGSETRTKSDTVYKYLLTPVLEECGYNVHRSDTLSNANKIDLDILNSLKAADLVIADLSGLNANVFYEIGYRYALGLPLIHIATEGTDLPFDVQTVRTQFYAIDDLGKAEAFKENLKNVIVSIEDRKRDIQATETDKNENGQEYILLENIFKLQDRIENLDSKLERQITNIDRKIEAYAPPYIPSKKEVNRDIQMNPILRATTNEATRDKYVKDETTPIKKSGSFDSLFI